MTNTSDLLLNKTTFSQNELTILLQSQGEEKKALFKKAGEIKRKFVGNKVFLRGLIELSNICTKDCLYCGIRQGNQKINRYMLSEQQVLEAAEYAWKNRYGSVVIQSGEVSSPAFSKKIEGLLKSIKKLSNDELGITLSLGEQDYETYQRWFDAGAHRYLLRIETSNRELYGKLHPGDGKHIFDERLQCLHDMKKIGYQVGTGVMIGLPFQTFEHLAADLMFMQDLDIDMVGMGPYIEHDDTPLIHYKDLLLPPETRFELSLKMIALLRIMMKDINIAATTAMQALDNTGREKAILAGANVMMPNITPGTFRDDYALYRNKPCTTENADNCKSCLEVRIGITGHEIGYAQWGDSPHYRKNSGCTKIPCD
jgi:biotin synthase